MVLTARSRQDEQPAQVSQGVTRSLLTQVVQLMRNELLPLRRLGQQSGCVLQHKRICQQLGRRRLDTQPS